MHPPLANKNHFLAQLPLSEHKGFFETGEVVQLKAQDTLNTAGQKINYVYFPIDCLICLMLTVDGKSIEAGLIGNEGMLGTPIFLGAKEATYGAVVQIAGKAYRLSASEFINELNKSNALRILMSRYILSLMNRLSISVGCHHFHTTEKRLAYLLLTIQESINATRLHITQAAISNILGVRRSSISEAANLLHQMNIIQYSRGRIDILDKIKLEAESCSCYQAAQESFKWAMPMP